MTAGYLDCLNSPKVSVVNTPILSLVSGGIRTEKGETPFDIIVWATGFKTNQFVHGVEVVGRDGEVLNVHWDRLGGPGAYMGTAVHGFPNFFMVSGPNLITGHTSALLAIEK